MTSKLLTELQRRGFGRSEIPPAKGLHPAEENELNQRLDKIEDLLVRLVPQEDWLTTVDVAKRYKVNRHIVLVWVSCGLPRYEFGKGFRFKLSDVETFLENFRRQVSLDMKIVRRESA